MSVNDSTTGLNTENEVFIKSRRLLELEKAADNFADWYNIGAIELVNQIFRNFAGLTRNDIRLVIKSVDGNLMRRIMVPHPRYHKPISDLICDSVREAAGEDAELLNKIAALSFNDTMELAYRVCVVNDIELMLMDELQYMFRF